MEAQQQQYLMMGSDEHGGKLGSSINRKNNSGNNNNVVAGNNGSSSSSSTRWTPTTDQIRILKDLYYNNGVRSPTADQIQRISARLRQYGKIEGKNVFYWFQNHKARERQKKRFNTTNNNNNSIIITTNNNNNSNTVLSPVPPAAVWKPSESSTAYVHSAQVSKYPSNSQQHPICPAGNNQVTGFGYGSTTMEKSFRDCSISAGGSSMGHGFGWAAGGMDHHHLSHHPYPYASPYPIYDQQKSLNSDEYHEFEENHRCAEIETLPLFPMHGEDTNYGFCHHNSTENDGWFHRDVGGTRASLELSLNSCAGMDRI